MTFSFVLQRAKQQRNKECRCKCVALLFWNIHILENITDTLYSYLIFCFSNDFSCKLTYINSSTHEVAQIDFYSQIIHHGRFEVRWLDNQRDLCTSMHSMFVYFVWGNTKFASKVPLYNVEYNVGSTWNNSDKNIYVRSNNFWLIFVYPSYFPQNKVSM